MNSTIATPTGTQSATQINSARASNIASGLSPYAGAGSTNLSTQVGLNNTSSASLSNTPVNTTPSASAVSTASPLNMPPNQTGASTAAGSSIATSQGALLALTGANLSQDQGDYDAQKTQVQGLINQYANKGQDTLNMENAAGTPEMQAAANTANTQYLAQQKYYDTTYQQIMNAPGGTLDSKFAQIQDLQNSHASTLANLGITAALDQNDYTNAQNIIDNQINLKYSTLQDQINYGMQFLSQNQDRLTAAQQQDYTAKLQVQQQTVNQGIYNDQLQSQTKIQMIQDAQANGADSATLKAIWDAPDIGSAAAAGGTFTQNGNYTPVQTGYDANTGLPIYSGFNQKTGQLQVFNPNGSNGQGLLGQTGSQQTTVSGADGTSYQMGATTTQGAYASATSTQVNNITATVAKINSTVGNITDATAAQKAINSVAPDSPITGTMIMSAAQQYGVDPSTLIGVMQAETQCGTDGSKGAEQCNWGNVGNTDSAMAAGKSVAMTPQEGVDAVAQNLSQRKVQEGQNDPAQPSNQSLTPQQVAGQAIKNAPAYLQPAMSFINATGDTYIDSSKVPTGMQIVAQNYSAQTGIPILSSAQVSDIQDINTAIQNVQQVGNQFGQLAANGWLGKAGNKIASTVEGVFGATTPWKQGVNAYNSTTVESAISALKEITGSSRLSQFVSNVSTDSLPKVGAGMAFGFGSSDDTISGGQLKVDAIVGNLNNALKSILPNSPGAKVSISQPSAQTYTVNGQNYTLGTDGTYYLTPSTK